MTPATQIDGLEIKLRQLAAQIERQRASYEAVVADNKKLQRELDHQTGVVSALQDKLERTQSSDNGKQVTAAAPPTTPPATTTADAAAHRQTIEFCLGEIDRCLDWLHRN